LFNGPYYYRPSSRTTSTQAQLQRDLEVSQQNFEALNREYQSTEVQLSRFRKLLQTQRAAAKRLEGALAKAQLEEFFGATVASLRGQCERHLESLAPLAIDCGPPRSGCWR
jgi:chromosome segregation ATPase